MIRSADSDPSIRGEDGAAANCDPSDPGEGRLVAGIQPVREAIRAHGSKLTRVALDGRRSPRLLALEQFARDQGVAEILSVSGAQLDRWCRNTEHQGALAWAPPLRLIELNQVLGEPDLGAIALDGIHDPQNFGAIVRSAVGVADAPVLFGAHSAAPLSPAMFRASAGAIEHARLCRVGSIRDAIEQAANRGIQAIGLDPRAERHLQEFDLDAPTLVVIGNEHRGMQKSVRKSCTSLARLVPNSRIESLNASVAAGIALAFLQMKRIQRST